MLDLPSEGAVSQHTQTLVHQLFLDLASEKNIDLGDFDPAAPLAEAWLGRNDTASTSARFWRGSRPCYNTARRRRCGTAWSLPSTIESMLPRNSPASTRVSPAGSSVRGPLSNEDDPG